MKFPAAAKSGARALLAASLVGLALAGCGGGDGDSSSIWDDVLPLAITDANMNAVAGSVIMADTAASFLPVGGGDIALVGAETGAVPSPTRKLVELAIAKSRAARNTLGTQDVVSGVEGSQTFACLEGGTFTLAFNITSPDYLSVGDVLSFTFNSCSEFVEGVLETLDGRMSVRVTSISGDLNPYGSLGESVQLTNLKVTTPSYILSSNGVMQLDETYNTDNTTTFAYSSAELTYKIVIRSAEYNTRLTNWSNTGVYYVSGSDEITEWQTTHDMAAIFPTFTGSFVVSTPLTVVEYLGATGITAGQLTVTGSNSVLDMTFQPGNLVLLQLDSDNDGDIDVERTVGIDELNPLIAATL